MTRKGLLESITSWQQSGKQYMLIVCDTFGYEDYPSFCTEEECLVKLENPGKMQRIMEVYNSEVSLQMQIDEDRAWHVPEKGGNT